MTDSAPLFFDTKLGGLSDIISYDPDTGALFWKNRPASMFLAGKQTAEHNAAIWNGKFAGKPALASSDKRGYLTGHLFSKPVKAHRVIWHLVHGVMPTEVDHINGNTGDNRLVNLRAVTHKTNGRNMRLKKNNSTGSCGVYQHKSGRWYARITIDGAAQHLGTFDSHEQALDARQSANVTHGFHPTHGETK